MNPTQSSLQKMSADFGRRGAIHALRQHWKIYLMEAWGLGTFMTGASILTTLLEYPASPLHQQVPSMMLRLVILGVGMASVVAGIIYCPWGKRSGAHINPSVTWAFYRLGKIGFWDALFYTIAQFLGAIVTIQIMSLLLGTPFQYPSVNFSMPIDLQESNRWKDRLR